MHPSALVLLSLAASSPVVPVTMQVARTRVGNIAYREGGNGPPLFLLHAAGHDHHDYDAVFDALAARHHVYAVDWPGHGASALEADATPVTVVTIADALLALVETLDVGPAVFVGSSVGGYAAQVLALSRPALVRALVLVDTGGFTERNLPARLFCAARGMEPVNRATWNVFPQFYFKKRNTHVNALLERVAENRHSQAVSVNASIWRSFMFPEHDLRQRASAISQPTLLVWGEDDPVIPVASGRLAARTLKNARLVVLPTGHVPFAEDPEAFLRAVQPFLEREAR